jgi:hypothetical protein
MGVFTNYDSRRAGGVNANAFPNVYPYPAVTTQQNVRANPNIPSQPQRISPTERGAWFPTSASGGGSLAPNPSLGQASGGCGCGGSCGGGIGTGASPNPPTASQLATGHAFHGMKGKTAPGEQSGGVIPRAASVGFIRPTANRTIAQGRRSGRTNATPTGSLFGTRMR